MKNGYSGLAGKLSEDAVPEEIGRRLKDTDVYDNNVNEGVVMSCPFCGEAFVRRIIVPSSVENQNASR